MSIVLWLDVLLTFVVIIVVIYYALRPTFLKYFLNKYIVSEYSELKNGKELNNLTYYTNPTKNAKKLIIYVCGGAFLTTDRRATYGFLNKLFEELSDTHDILVFDYKTRFKYNLRDTLLDFNQIITYYLKTINKVYDEYIGIGVSAGNLLLGAFINKELSDEISTLMNIDRIGITINKTISICGIFKLFNFYNNRIFDVLIKYYTLNGTPAQNYYTFYNTNVNKKQLVVSITSDYFYHQSVEFLKQTPSDYYIIQDPENQVPHNFITFSKHPETINTLNKIKQFLIT